MRYNISSSDNCFVFLLEYRADAWTTKAAYRDSGEKTRATARDSGEFICNILHK